LEKQRNSFLGGGIGQSREYSEKMAEDMDAYIKATLQEHYDHVKARLEEYRGAIENMVTLLYDKENITGAQVRELIKAFELENNMPSKLEQAESVETEEVKS
jgi:cell division protease FtsH